MKKTALFTLLFLALPAVALAKTPWESYLTLPAPEYASKVTEIEYSPESDIAAGDHVTSDLKILRNQVMAGDRESFRLAYRLIETSDDGLLGELVTILGNTIRVAPEFFLTQMADLNPRENILQAILLSPGTEYTDRTYAQRYEIYMRKMALTGVSDISLKDIRETCLELIEIH